MRGSSAAHSQLVNDLLLSLNEFGLFKKNVVGVFRPLYREELVSIGLVGSPDIEGILKGSGRYCGIEVKTGDAIQRKNQRTYQTVVEALGALYIVAYDADSVVNYLRNLSDK